GVARALGARRGARAPLRGVADRREGPARRRARRLDAGRRRDDVRAGPARDEQGRPIVAELGRAETPAETAARAAASRAQRRRNQTPLNLVLALAASFAVVLFLVLVVVRPDPPPRTGV